VWRGKGRVEGKIEGKANRYFKEEVEAGNEGRGNQALIDLTTTITKQNVSTVCFFP
jgi:hypothetical protein